MNYDVKYYNYNTKHFNFEKSVTELFKVDKLSNVHKLVSDIILKFLSPIFILG